MHNYHIKQDYGKKYLQEKEEYKKKYEKWHDSLTLDEIIIENKHRRKKRGKKLLKAPDQPKRAISPYIYFVVRNIDVNDGDDSKSRIAKLAKKWKSLPDNEKKVVYL